jgi:ketosteroid isomerase-like protein
MPDRPPEEPVMTDTDLVLRYYAAFNARDWAAYDELFAPDCTTVVTGTSEPLPGVAGVLAFDQGYVAAFPDAHVDSRARVAGGGTVVSENLGTGTMLGELRGPGGVIPPTGAHGEIHYAGAFDVAGGRIVAQRVYIDRMELLESTGATAAVAG